jgi:hypothetical protein
VTSSFLYFERDPYAPAKWQNRFWTGMRTDKGKRKKTACKPEIQNTEKNEHMVCLMG